jgi:hypothetical protein
MAEAQSIEKVIGFVDILGFKNMVRASETGTSLPLAELLEATKMLAGKYARADYEKYGPTTCPGAPRHRRDLDFEVTQVSDCVVVSAEFSPAGVINLISHCWGACINLLTKGIMCRGYIKIGRIHHAGGQFVGSGYMDALERERQVSFLKKDADDRGTPFIEVDPEVVAYVNACADGCVKEMFSRMTRADGGLTALFPIKRISADFAIGPDFSPEREHQQVEVVRGILRGMKDRVAALIDRTDPSAIRKGDHYLQMLDEQMAECDRTDEMIRHLASPFPAHRLMI